MFHPCTYRSIVLLLYKSVDFTDFVNFEDEMRIKHFNCNKINVFRYLTYTCSFEIVVRGLIYIVYILLLCKAIEGGMEDLEL